MAATCAALGRVTAVKTAPKRYGLVTRQTNFFKEKSERDASVMLQAMLADELAVNATKAERKVCRQFWDVVGSESRRAAEKRRSNVTLHHVAVKRVTDLPEEIFHSFVQIFG